MVMQNSSTPYIFEENPNSSAKIAFVMWTPFHFWVYRNIVKHLPEAEFVICDLWYKNVATSGPQRMEEVCLFLKNQNVRWRALTELNNLEIIESFFEKYEVVVSVWFVPPLDSFSFEDWLSKKKSVFISYGAGKDLMTFSPLVSRFDVSLVDGPRTHEYHKLFTNSYMVGVPKFDDWFNKAVDSEEVRRMKGALDPLKKTILYLPTHSGLSSLHEYAATIGALGAEYNVIVKLHYHNRDVDQKAVKALEGREGVHIVESSRDILPLYALADTIISDSSSAMFESLLVNKPLVILDILDPGTLEAHTNFEEFNGLWYSGALTYEKSIDQTVKLPNQEIGIVVKHPQDLRSALEKSISEPDGFADNRSVLRSRLFLSNDGRAGQEAAGVIRKLLQEPKPSLPPLGLASRSFTKMVQTNAKKVIQLKEQEILFLRREAAEREKNFRILSDIKEEKSFWKKAGLVAEILFKNDFPR